MTEDKKQRIWPQRVAKIVGALAVLAVVGALILLSMAWVPMGKAPEGERLERMQASAQWADGIFHNEQKMWNDLWGWIPAMTEASEYGSPNEPLPVVENAAEQLATPADGTRVTWLGHSTVLIEIAGKRVLTDPVFGPSTAPIAAFGPQRWYPPPVALDDLGDIDVVLISHDHYDHLDQPTIEKIASWDATFIVPLGVGAHLEYWGVPADQLIEVDWWETHKFGDLEISATPARHASGRQLLDQNRTLWAGYALVGPEHRIMFSGDTGLFDAMETIGEKYGPFDLVMIEVGAYHRTWPDWHIGPEQALVGHKMMRGTTFMPIHWGLFNLALHGWTEPIERTWTAAEKAGVPLAVPRPGEVLKLGELPEPKRWWPEVPYQTAEEHPIVSTRNGDPDDRYPAP